jgi:PLP dependent protein
MNSIASNLNMVKQRVDAAAKPENANTSIIKILAVSKTYNVDKIIEAFKAGQRCFGENQVQEAIAKIKYLKRYNIEWHFIGKIQSNKIRKLAPYFSWIHSVESEKVALKLNVCRLPEFPTLNVCIQVNIDNDPNKAGVAPNDVAPLASAIKKLPRLKLRGLMTIPKKHDTLEEDRDSYHRLKTLFTQLNEQGFELDTLSMGMSKDLEVAIPEGATILRIGKDIFATD